MENYSYITLLLNDAYTFGVMMLSESLQQVGSKYPLTCIITEDITPASLEILHQLNINTIKKDILPTPTEIYEYNCSIVKRFASTWKKTWTKFHVFDDLGFDKVIFLDCDILIQKNIDDLFERPHMTSALDGEYFNVWPDYPHFNAGIMVIEPSHENYQRLIDFAYSDEAKQKCLTANQVCADQEILNFYYPDWATHEELKLNKYYDIFAPYIQEEQIRDVEDNGYFIHYIGRKPWAFFLKGVQETYTEYFYQKAHDLIQDVCNKLQWWDIQKKNVLTVYAICKNEMQRIESFLNSFIEADYVCILDTGSTDGTYEYLQKYQKKHKNLIIGQKIINPWRYDEGRNESMKLIPADTTIFFMADIDEVIKEKGWCDEIKKCWLPNFERGQYLYNRNVEGEDNVTKAIWEYRVHSKKWNHWKNLVHENLYSEDEEVRFYMENCTKLPIVVWHYPTSVKSESYAEMCGRAVLEDPDNWLMRLQWAIELEIIHDTDKAYENFELLTQHPDKLQDFEVARSFYGMGRILAEQNRINEATYAFLRGRAYCPRYADNYIAEAINYFNKAEYEMAAALLKEAFKNCNQAEWCTVYDINSYYTYFLLAMCYYNMHKKAIALGYLTLAKQKGGSQEVDNLFNTIINEFNVNDIGMV